MATNTQHRSIAAAEEELLSSPVITIFSSSSRTASENSSDQSNWISKGVRLFLDITAATGTTPTLDLKVQVKDVLTGNYHDLPDAAFAQQTTTGTAVLTIYPSIAETANVSVSDVLGRDWRVVATIGGTTPDFTFSLSAEYLK